MVGFSGMTSIFSAAGDASAASEYPQLICPHPTCLLCIVSTLFLLSSALSPLLGFLNCRSRVAFATSADSLYLGESPAVA